MTYQELNTASITALVHEFYNDVRADPDLFPIFNAAIGSNWGPHLDRMVDFWSTVMLGSKSFQGNVYGKHMLLTGINKDHFVRWLSLFEATSSRLFRPEIAKDFQITAQRISSSLQYGYFGSTLV
ncbi:group III truncated hemoglobin [Duganella violaceipulchra]|uniref:Hemoglobin n=1 Tax=Duganella violaceipulchra TaxID=2849652 RepID=A0ABT1GUY1_9BURK|nr:group III truncated hemoglobin [Duganella violaceicalia]MCP2012792.1 hemoglobin [Duganella violaceicalia]